MLAFDDNCGCEQFGRRHHKDIADPEEDLEQRINEEIQGSIADILTEIVQNAFHQALEHSMDFS
jgi:hypothetical protein